MNHGWGNEEEVANMGELYVDYTEETLLMNITSNGEFLSKLLKRERTSTLTMMKLMRVSETRYMPFLMNLYIGKRKSMYLVWGLRTQGK